MEHRGQINLGTIFPGKIYSELPLNLMKYANVFDYFGENMSLLCRHDLESSIGVKISVFGPPR